ncbi:zinc-dependent metalloprotease family protein, partial [Arthrospira platensis SPKY2]
MTNPSGTQLTTYRLRIVTTAQYTSFFTNPADAVVTTVNRMDGIYEREVSIRFNLVSTDNLDGSEADYPFAASPSVNGAFLTANNDWLNATYGVGSYDIGHVFGQGGGGGLAELASV